MFGTEPGLAARPGLGSRFVLGGPQVMPKRSKSWRACAETIEQATSQLISGRAAELRAKFHRFWGFILKMELKGFSRGSVVIRGPEHGGSGTDEKS